MVDSKPLDSDGFRAVDDIQPTFEAGNVAEELGIDFVTSGLLGNPTTGQQFWQWMRDERLQDPGDLWQVAGWCGALLGIGTGGEDLSRWMFLGFAQGAYCASCGVELSERIANGSPTAPSLLTSVAGLRLDPVGSPMTTVRQALRSWIENESSGLTPEDAWRSGLRLGAARVGEGCIVAAAVLVQMEEAELEQRFVLGHIANAIQRPSINPWFDFVVSTYRRHSVEGLAIGVSFEVSLELARRECASLGQFLASASDQGFGFARQDREAAMAVAACHGVAARDAVARMYANDGVDPEDPCLPEVLLSAAVRYVHRSHGLLVSSRLPGCAAVVIRHAYDYLWWHGFLGGLGEIEGNRE